MVNQHHTKFNKQQLIHSHVLQVWNCFQDNLWDRCTGTDCFICSYCFWDSSMWCYNNALYKL